jgi:HD superfamily phosphohydrolase
MPSSTTVRDPIHGMVQLAPHEWAAVDAPAFQRLRNIRQLAMTHLVYPSAVHTRFEHSIGVCHIAGRLADRLKLDPEQAQVVRAAALLHDIGHGPFSHVSEQVIDDLAGVHGVHEAISAFMIRNDPTIVAALGEDLSHAAAAIVALAGPRSVERDIVSGPTDADKLDYLLRDSYFAGVKYGEYDLERLIDSSRIIAPRSAQTQLGFDADGLWAVEGLLMARHHMHRQVYGHKTRLATDIMITRALRFAIHEGAVDPAAFTVPVAEGRPQITQAFVERYLAQVDARVLDQLCAAHPTTATGDLGLRIRDRRLLRQTSAVRLDMSKDELGDTRVADLLDSDVTTTDVIAQMESAIAERLCLPSHLVALHVDARTNPTYRNPGSIRPKDVMIQRGDGQARLLQSESEIFRSELGENHAWIFLYSPALDEDLDQRAKEELWNQLSAP